MSSNNRCQTKLVRLSESAIHEQDTRHLAATQKRRTIVRLATNLIS